MKTRICTASPKRTRKRLQDAGLDPSKYFIGPQPSEWTDSNLDELIRRDLSGEQLERYYDMVREKQYTGCSGCGRSGLHWSDFQ